MNSLPKDLVDRLWKEAEGSKGEFRNSALDLIAVVGGNRKFWDETDSCQGAVNGVATVIEKWFQAGFRVAAKLAIAQCEGRASVAQKSMSVRQEARKCAYAIEWMLLESDPCPYCEGSGWVRVDFEHPQSMSCQWCSATGRVKKGNPLTDDEIESREEIEAKDAQEYDGCHHAE
jgi:predicted metal-binding protein